MRYLQPSNSGTTPGIARGRRFAGALAACLAFVCIPATAAQTVSVTTLEWPPYTGESLPKMGATTEVIRQAFAAMQTELKVQVLPWKRAIATAKQASPAIAYFPGYHCKHVDGFVASNPIGNGPLGLAEHKDSPVSWASVDDLGKQKLKIGTVLGYSNTAEFDKKVGTGWIRAISAKNDATNLRKLQRRRIDAAVIDKLVLSYLLASDKSLKSAKDVLRFNDKPLEMKILHLCFVDSEAGRSMRDKFNAALKSVDVEKVISDYFDSEF